MDRGSRRCNRASRKNPKKKPKERHKVATEDEEEPQDNNKKYNRRLSQRTLKVRLKFLKVHIRDKIKEGRGNQINKLAESINNNVVNGTKIWEIMRKVKKRTKLHPI